MGQLERYGLYVLVLVIFLILGVAIWGDEPASLSDEKSSLRVHLAGGDTGESTPVRELLDPAFEGPDDPFDVGTGTGPVTPAVTPPPVEPPVAEEPKSEPVVREEPKPEAAKPAAEKPELRDYVIRKGDSLWVIARDQLGSVAPSEIDRIVRLNPGIDADALPVGHSIKLPARREAKAPGAAGRIHVVKKGENPSTIAQMTLGSQKYAKAIMEANGITDEYSLREGMELVIPAVRKN